MKNYILNKVMDNIKNLNNHTDLELKEIRYGLEALYLTIFKTILYVLLSIIFNYFYYLLMYMLFYGLLRITGFGAHAKKAIHCWIGSSLFFIGVPLLSKYLVINKIVNYSISIICIILLSIFAPADTEKRPLIHKNKRIIYKVLTIIISISYLVYMIIGNNIGIMNVMLFSLITEAFMVNPICYKIFGVSYCNYKKYLNRKEIIK